MPRLGNAAQKILLLLLAGVALGLSGSPRRNAHILRSLGREWAELDRRALRRAIRQLYESKLVRCIPQKDGTAMMVLNKEGKKIALHYKLDEMRIQKPTAWDKVWRVVLFDIPESQKKLRDAFRMRLQQLGLVELQKSVFVHPYECRNEIDFVIELYNARRFVRFIEATHIDTELHLKKKFNLV